jgi:DNA polymerase-3 subunit epsilon
MIVVDVETTGLDPINCAIASIGAIDFESPDRRFYAEPFVRQWWDCDYVDPSGVTQVRSEVHVSDYALQVNGFTVEQMRSEDRPSLRQVVYDFAEWLSPIKERTLAGENPRFDLDFLRVAFGRYGTPFPLGYRTVDMHSIAYYLRRQRHLDVVHKDGISSFGADSIFQFVGLTAEPKPHNAMTGALMEAEALHRLMYGKAMLDEFKEYDVPDRIQHWCCLYPDV